MTIVTSTNWLLLFIATTSWTCVSVAYSQAISQPVTGIADSEEKLVQIDLHEASQSDLTPQTPVDVFMHVIESIRTGDRKRILEDAVP